MRKLDLKCLSQVIESVLIENEAFSHISVSDAISAVRALAELDLIIRKYSNEERIIS